MREEKAFWNRVADFYGRAMKGSDGLYQEIADRIAKDLGGDEKVLELASGTGQITYKLYEKAGSYEATDFSPKMVEEGEKREHGSILHWAVEDATKLSYPDKSFDVVIIANCLHIMPEPKKAMKEIRRVLKDDGVLYAPTFVVSDRFLAKLRIFIMGLGGFKVYSHWRKEDFEGFVRESGFTPILNELLGGDIIPLSFLKANK